jgi:hypothetical protein
MPSDNEYDVPSLRMDRQATSIAPPVIPWGSLARGTEHGGTWVFYVDDYRFSALLHDPLQLPETSCNSTAEPNITLFDQMPRYAVLEAIGRKRRAARVWQDAGINVLVDLNVPMRRIADCMLGVPAGWRAFATRGYAARIHDLETEHCVATEWAGGEPLLLVYGGGRDVEQKCRSLRGAVYVPDFSQRRRGRVPPERKREALRAETR